ncbi:MAG: hypothetical protein LUO97_02560, partial [Methanomicrobiales archaeon]|nr:hypothetical protein [Methanomicrobiales archaeon]
GSMAIPCIPLLTRRPGSLEYDLGNQTTRMKALESAFDQKGIFYVKMYDALDTHPFNERLDGINTTYMPDGMHPDQLGQHMMARYVWNELLKKYPLSELLAN